MFGHCETSTTISSTTAEALSKSANAVVWSTVQNVLLMTPYWLQALVTAKYNLHLWTMNAIANILLMYAISVCMQIVGLLTSHKIYRRKYVIILRSSKFRICIWHRFQAILMFSSFRTWMYTCCHYKWRHIVKLKHDEHMPD